MDGWADRRMDAWMGGWKRISKRQKKDEKGPRSSNQDPKTSFPSLAESSLDTPSYPPAQTPTSGHPFTVGDRDRLLYGKWSFKCFLSCHVPHPPLPLLSLTTALLALLDSFTSGCAGKKSGGSRAASKFHNVQTLQTTLRQKRDDELDKVWERSGSVCFSKLLPPPPPASKENQFILKKVLYFHTLTFSCSSTSRYSSINWKSHDGKKVKRWHSGISKAPKRTATHFPRFKIHI